MIEHESGYELTGLKDVHDYAEAKLDTLKQRVIGDMMVYSGLAETDYNLGYYACLRRMLIAINSVRDK